MGRWSDSLGGIVAGIIALVLVLSDVALTWHGTVDSGLQAAVPVIVAAYFGSHASNAGWQQRRRLERAAGEPASESTDGGGGTA